MAMYDQIAIEVSENQEQYRLPGGDNDLARVAYMLEKVGKDYSYAYRLLQYAYAAQSLGFTESAKETFFRAAIMRCWGSLDLEAHIMIDEAIKEQSNQESFHWNFANDNTKPSPWDVFSQG